MLMLAIALHISASDTAPTPTSGAQSFIHLTSLPPTLVVADSTRSYARPEAVEAITACARQVATDLPGGEPLRVGDLSLKHGGAYAPHRLHKDGLDADLGFFRNRSKTIDLARETALLQCFIERGAVEAVLVDQAIKNQLVSHAPVPLKGTLEATLRHYPGHRTHTHLIFRRRGSRQLVLTASASASAGTNAEPRKDAQATTVEANGDAIAASASEQRRARITAFLASHASLARR